MNKIYTQNKDLRKLIDTNLKPVVLTRSISNHKKVFYIYLVLFVTSLSLSFLLLSNNVNAQNYYSLQFSDTSTYDNTCGTVKPSQWSVKNDSCILYTPYFRNESPGCTNVVYDFLINQSGNGDVDDHVYIQYQLDGGPWITDTLLFASNYAAVHNLTGTINICYGNK
jgi:hypothetical protein